tara:strand:- start:41114 stop:41425 length:312 start_codon:yes stop_codon:yes gene_type:complete
MKPTTDTDDLDQHQLKVLRARRKAITLWLVLSLACLLSAVAAATSFPVLERNGIAWVLILFALAGAAFIYVIQALDRSSKALWPSSPGDLAAAAKSTAPRNRV